MKYQLLAIIILIVPVSLAVQRFDNYKVYSVNVANDKQLKAVQNLEKSDFDFWESPAISHVADVMVSPDQEEYFESLMDTHRIQREIKIQNVQE